MDYFIMKTDSRLRRLPQLQIPEALLNTVSTGQPDSTTAGCGRGNGRGIGKEAVPVIHGKEQQGLHAEYPDYIEAPIPLIAEKLHKILYKYQRDAEFDRVVLIEKDTGRQRVYYRMIPPCLECADKSKTAYDVHGNILDFVLDAKAVGGNKIFRVRELNHQIAVCLDVAESILRRDAGGIWFEPLKQ